MKKEENYIFNFDDFVKESLTRKKSRDTFLEYGKYYGSLEGTALEDTYFYKEYLSKFDVSGFRVACPQGAARDFDYALLAQLIAASFCSDYELHLDEQWKASPTEMPLVDIRLLVSYDTQDIDVFVHKLSSQQIYTLFDIYLCEYIGNSVIQAQHNGEGREAIELEWQMKLRKYKKHLRALLREAEQWRQEHNNNH